MAENRIPTHEEMISFQFINMVLQTSNMAMMFLGKLAHPETGQTMLDLEATRMFIDQLEMISVKTKGNLNHDEQKVLNDSLTSLRLMFVETANDEKKKSQNKAVEQGNPTQQAASTPGVDTAAAPNDAGETTLEDDSRKKFVKKY
ncbi:MAG: DUF1844 domain-containing protein [Verrucomicrobiales bacterium]